MAVFNLGAQQSKELERPHEHLLLSIYVGRSNLWHFGILVSVSDGCMGYLGLTGCAAQSLDHWFSLVHVCRILAFTCRTSALAFSVSVALMSLDGIEAVLTRVLFFRDGLVGARRRRV